MVWKDPEARRAYQRRRYHADPERQKEKVRRYRQTEAGQATEKRIRWRQRWAQHHTTPEQAEERLAAQGGLCAVAREPLTLELAQIDHDHGCCPGRFSCGHCIRGLVCRACNTKVGLVEDGRLAPTPEIAAYLSQG